MAARGVRVAAGALVILLALGATPKGWYRYDKSTLIEQDFNDGDSFHVRCRKRHYIIRLYFVDAPETESSFPQRVQDQADYWALSPKQVVDLGKQATRFTHAFLAKPFTVHTRRVDARGRSDKPRFFGMIETDAGYLSEALVRNGLARIYGMPTALPDGRASSRHFGRLRLAQKAAKREKLGGWATRPEITPPPPPIEEQNYRVRTRLAVFDPDRHARVLGFLKRGAIIRILKAENDALLRIRFTTGETEREGVCRRDSIDLGPDQSDPFKPER
jgi:endonuclease YncB( thermonuclease family)